MKRETLGLLDASAEEPFDRMRAGTLRPGARPAPGGAAAPAAVRSPARPIDLAAMVGLRAGLTRTGGADDPAAPRVVPEAAVGRLRAAMAAHAAEMAAQMAVAGFRNAEARSD